MFASTQQLEHFETFFKQNGNRLTYKKGEYVIRPGESPSGVFLIESGLVKAYDITKYGEDNLLIIRRPHEVIPLIWGLTGEERHVIYETLSPAVLWQTNRQDFYDFIQKHADTLPPLIDMLVEMYRLHSERILNLEYRSVRERLVSFLLMMAGRFGRETDGGLVIEVSLRHQDIASSINASRETTSREIAILERQQLLLNHQSTITLLDAPKLRSLL